MSKDTYSVSVDGIFWQSVGNNVGLPGGIAANVRQMLYGTALVLVAPHPVEAATDVAYTLIHELIHRYLRARKDEFRCEFLALAGGVAINAGPVVGGIVGRTKFIYDL